MWIRIAALGPVRYINRPLVRIRRHGGNMSRNAERMLAATRRVHRKAYRAGLVPRWRADFWLRVKAVDHFQGAWMYWDERRSGARPGARIPGARSLAAPARSRRSARAGLFQAPRVGPFSPAGPVPMNTAPLRILHVVFSLDAGGMENGIVNVSAALAPAEFDLHVCCLSPRR